MLTVLNILEDRYGPWHPFPFCTFVSSKGWHIPTHSSVNTSLRRLAKPSMSKAPASFDTAFETYSVTGVLGEGGAGRVFLVRDGSGSEYALKCLFPARVTTEKKKRFRNEVTFCEKVKHLNIIRVVDAGVVLWDSIKCPFYVMPCYEMTLRGLLEEGIAHDRVLKLFSQIIDGVEAGHFKGVIHRDLKPENVLYDPKDDRLVVADFGIAHFEEDIVATVVSTKATTKLANLRYSAPEQRVPGAKVDHRADIFSLGLILNELFTNSVPQGAGYKKIVSVTSQYSYLDPVVDRMIQQDPTARFPSLEEVKKELIARGNEFVAFQQLRAKEQEVVPTTAIHEVMPTKIIDVDWQKNMLFIRLDRVPENGWIQRFKSPREGFTSISSAHPSQVQFNSDKASVYAEERDVQTIVDLFKNHLQIADRGYQRDLEEEATSRDYERRQQLIRERKEAERRAQVLKSIKI
jgi:serine/threonine protein kinase